MRYIISIIMILNLLTNTAEAAKKPAQLTNKNAILSIIGEAEGEPQRGRLAVACAIRSRGHLRGVYGLNAPRVKSKKYSQSTYKAAALAWEQSAIPSNCGFIGGANGWENIGAFGAPSWVKYSTLTAVIGSHRFYIQDTKHKGA